MHQLIKQQLKVIEGEADVERHQIKTQLNSKSAQLSMAQKELAKHRIAMERAQIRAPMDGVITNGELNVNDILQPRAPILEIAPKGDMVFEAQVSGKDVALTCPSRLSLRVLSPYLDSII